eukprot:4531476-Pyramimonas_sp.AAC.1
MQIAASRAPTPSPTTALSADHPNAQRRRQTTIWRANKKDVTLIPTTGTPTPPRDRTLDRTVA